MSRKIKREKFAFQIKFIYSQEQIRFTNISDFPDVVFIVINLYCIFELIGLADIVSNCYRKTNKNIFMSCYWVKYFHNLLINFIYIAIEIKCHWHIVLNRIWVY